MPASSVQIALVQAHDGGDYVGERPAGSADIGEDGHHLVRIGLGAEGWRIAGHWAADDDPAEFGTCPTRGPAKTVWMTRQAGRSGAARGSARTDGPSAGYRHR
jgi:hypothetical protein